eukprot:673061_1
MSTFVLCTWILITTLHVQHSTSATDYSNGDITSDDTSTLYQGDSIVSYDSLVKLKLAPTGTLVIKTRTSSTTGVWNNAGFDTYTSSAQWMTLESDGELVLYNSQNGIEWTSNSMAGTAPFRLIVSDDVAVYILDSLNTVVWSSNPSFAELNTIWHSTFDSDDGLWALDGSGAKLPSSSSYCPYSVLGDKCLKLEVVNGYNTNAQRTTAISTYQYLQFQVDISGRYLGTDDYCQIWWQFEVGDWFLYDGLYTNSVYRDVILDIPLSSSHTSLTMALEIQSSGSDICYFSNAILRGRLITQDPTNLPSSSPTIPPTTIPTKQPTKNPTSYPTNKPTMFPTKYPTLSPTKEQTSSPSGQPTSLFPTSNPTLPPVRAITSQPTTDDPTTLIPSQYRRSTSINMKQTSSPSGQPTSLFPTSNPTLPPVRAITSQPTTDDPTTLIPSQYRRSTSINMKQTSSVEETTGRGEAIDNANAPVAVHVVTLYILAAAMASACCFCLAVVIICKVRQKKAGKMEKRVMSMSHGDDIGDVKQVNVSAAPPTVHVQLQGTNRNNDRIIAPVVTDMIRDEEMGIELTNAFEGDEEQYSDDDDVIDNDLCVTAGAGNADPHFERMVSDDVMVQELVMDDIVDEMNEIVDDNPTFTAC